MKTKHTFIQRGIKGVMLVLALVSTIVSASAQRPKHYNFGNYYRTPSVFILGVEGGVSMRTFTVKSDISSINGLNVVEEGWSTGLLIGGNNFRTRLIFGNYQTSSTVSKKVGEKSFGGQMSIYPLSLLGVQSKYFQPYILTGIELSNISFSGSYIPQPKIENTGAGQQCPCQCPGGLPADPDQVTGSGSTSTSTSSGPPSNPSGDPDIEEPAKKSVDKLLATQALAGVGLEINFTSGGRFYSMFGEARYGMSLGEEALTRPLLNTSISGQMALYFGIRIGLSK